MVGGGAECREGGGGLSVYYFSRFFDYVDGQHTVNTRSTHGQHTVNIISKVYYLLHFLSNLGAEGQKNIYYFKLIIFKHGSLKIYFCL